MTPPRGGLRGDGGPMKLMTYQQGKGFAETEAPDLPEWKDGEDFEAWLGRAGFEKYASRIVGTGEECSTSLRTHHRTDAATRAWYALVEFNDVDRFDHILVTTAADHLALLAALAPVVAASAAYELSELRALAKKAFRAWHGHRAEGVCYACDPEATKAIEEVRRRRRERQAADAVNQAEQGR